MAEDLNLAVWYRIANMYIEIILLVITKGSAVSIICRV